MNENKKTAEQRTFKSLWENFWYYHKFAFWFFLIMLICVFFAFDPFGDHTKPDYQIALLTEKSWTPQHQNRLQKLLEQYGDDLNGDGKVVVKLNYMLQPKDSSAMELSEYEAYKLKVISSFEGGDTMIYLVDDFNLRNYGVVEGLFSVLEDYSTLPENDKITDTEVLEFDLEQIGIPWQNLSGVNRHPFFCRSKTKLYFCFRAIVPAMDEDAIELRKATMVMFERIRNNQPRDPEALEQLLKDSEYEYTSSTAALQSVSK
jgi:hypothetical protein